MAEAERTWVWLADRGERLDRADLADGETGSPGEEAGEGERRTEALVSVRGVPEAGPWTEKVMVIAG